MLAGVEGASFFCEPTSTFVTIAAAAEVGGNVGFKGGRGLAHTMGMLKNCRPKIAT